MNLDWPALETERLILRPWKPDDFEPYARFSADEESMRYLGRDGRPTDAAETWRTICLFIGHWYLRGYTLWAVDRARWGRGYATEAARAAADWVHRTLGADHVVHFIHERNVRSIRVAEKLGAKRDGTCKLFGTIDVLVYRTGLPLAPSARVVAG